MLIYYRGNTERRKVMNKNKVQKIINELKESLINPKTLNNRLYMESWVIGSLETIEEKMDGKLYYPYNETYKELFNAFETYFYCKNISEHIKNETKERLLTEENIVLVQELKRCIYGKESA